MTREQLEWMKANSQYSYVGRAAAFTRYDRQGALKSNGTLVLLTKTRRIRAGETHVGILVHEPPGTAAAPTAREYNER